MKALTKNLRRFDKNRKILFWSLACLIFMFVSFYGYLVSSTVLKTVRLSSLEEEKNVVADSVSELEARYLKDRRGVTISAARLLGFETASVARFISKRTVTALRPEVEL